MSSAVRSVFLLGDPSLLIQSRKSKQRKLFQVPTRVSYTV